MPESVSKKSAFERELDWNGLGWSSDQLFYSFIVDPWVLSETAVRCHALKEVFC